MELRALIEQAEQQTGGRRQLATSIGLNANALTNAKHGRTGLPDFACFQLAKLLGIDPAIVIAASALVTEKNPERRAIFTPFANLARLAGIAGIALIGMTAEPSESLAGTGFTPLSSVVNWHYVKTRKPIC